MIVVDTNVIAYALIEGDRTAAARALFERDPDWRLPSLWRHEFLNVLATYGRHTGTPAQSLRAVWRRATARFGASEEAVDAELALGLAITHDVSAYDGQFLALARHLAVPLVTEDRRLHRTFPTLARSIRAHLGRDT